MFEHYRWSTKTEIKTENLATVKKQKKSASHIHVSGTIFNKPVVNFIILVSVW